ncbi:MAG TPA: hypothetical protein VMZ53_20405 [Kofleriaceae bacterium]|nr:hypothetical protein [Kofleriaceae bacterium]
MRRAALLVLVVAGCAADIDEPWELDHDRIIAVRAEPPGILAGQQSKLDMLVGFKASPVAERAPDFAQVVSPMSLADLVHNDGMGGWVVDAPTDERLAAVRAELKLSATDPVPLRIGIAAAWPTPVVSPMGNGFGAVKTVLLGLSVSNPALDGMMINGADPGTTDLVVPAMGKTPLFVQADDEVNIVNWLTSAGTMHDFDLHSAYLTFEPEDMTEGQLCVVLRDPFGGVAWRFWSLRAE